ncbi:MAG: hypothetical protein K2J23_03660, partial [Muribaculaceae bacterium]|nr:hypothetical protein [Muribaculaceae bacterium]
MLKTTLPVKGLYPKYYYYLFPMPPNDSGKNVTNAKLKVYNHLSKFFTSLAHQRYLTVILSASDCDGRDDRAIPANSICHKLHY